MVAEDYIHRIGRTGRAGATGIAITLVGPEDRSKLFGIERLTGRKLEREVIPGLEPRQPASRGGRSDGNTRRNPKSNGNGKPRFGADRPAAKFAKKEGRDGGHFKREAGRSGAGFPAGGQRRQRSRPAVG